MRAVSVAVLTALSLTIPAAEAAVETYIGKWQCYMGNKPPPGGPNWDLWLYTFEMNLTGQGNFSATGKYEAASAGYAVPFVITDGTWEEAEGGLSAKGKWSNEGTLQDFYLGALPQADGTLTYSTTSGYGTMTVACKR
ncbi:MAG: hypothetical protein QM698_13295 [Micropepsaceae bacterium]